MAQGRVTYLVQLQLLAFYCVIFKSYNLTISPMQTVISMVTYGMIRCSILVSSAMPEMDMGRYVLMTSLTNQNNHIALHFGRRSEVSLLGGNPGWSRVIAERSGVVY